MLKNYTKIALAVLWRRKFLTFVNLFGAALTLTVLVVAFAMYQSIVNPGGALSRSGHILSVTSLVLRGERGTLGSGPGEAFYREYIANLQTPDLISFSTGFGAVTSYVDGRKIESQLSRTDAAFWKMLDFDLLDGRLLSADDIDRGRFVAVISKSTAEKYFPGRSAIGETLVAGSEKFEVVGIVADEPATNLLSYADIWVPLTTATGGRDAWSGSNRVMLYLEDTSRIPAVKAELATALESFVYTPDPAQFTSAAAPAQTMLELLASQIMGEIYRSNVPGRDMVRNRVAEFVGVSIVVVLLFMALPAINMANLNIGRILERAPEIGLRKAAGASRSVLAGQFIFENIVLSLLGGLIAFALAPFMLHLLNGMTSVFGGLRLNLSVFLAGFVFVLVFGVLSGAWPAWKMARLDPAAALKGLQDA